MWSQLGRYRVAVGVLTIGIVALAILLLRGPGVQSAPAAAGTSMRAAIDQAVRTETQGLDTPEAVDAYLDRLESRARAQGKVTAVEIEPGITAIDRLRSSLGEERVLEKRNQFSRRMEQLQFDLLRKTADGKSL